MTTATKDIQTTKEPIVLQFNNVHKDSVREVWAIDLGDGQLLPPFDCDPCDEFMAFPSREDAEVALQRQIEMYGIDEGEFSPHPVKLF